MNSPTIEIDQFAKYILNSLSIVKDKDGLCSFPTLAAQVLYDKAIGEVSKWLTRIRQETFIKAANIASNFSPPFGCDEPYCLGWNTATRGIAKAIQKIMECSCSKDEDEYQCIC